MSQTRDATPTTEGSWLDHHPSIAPLAAAATFLALAHGAFAAWLHASVNTNMAWGLARFGVLVGFVTALLLIPLVFVLARRLGAWKRGQRDRAYLQASVFVTLTSTIWMVAERFFVQLELGLLAPFLALVSALVLAGSITMWLELPRRAVRIGLFALPISIGLALLPFGPGGPPTAPQNQVSEKDASEIPRLRPSSNTDEAPVDVVLITIDTLRADRLGVYGQEPTLTPNLDRLAAEGTVFERTLASSPWTVPSLASLITGLPSSRHGAGLPFSAGLTFLRSPLPEEHPTVAERFATAGYRSHALIANGFAVGLGMGRGFDEVVDVIGQAVGLRFGKDFPLVRLLVEILPPSGDYRAQGVTDQALARLESDSDAPLFLWAHYIDPHMPYQADPSHFAIDAWTGMAMMQTSTESLPDGTVVGETFSAIDGVRSGMLWLTAEDRQRLAEYYDRAVAYADREVGRLLDALRERAKTRKVVVAFTSDHGEELWDHGGFEHGHDYYREVTHVPLILWGEGVPAGHRVESVVGLVDVSPTLIQLAGFQTHPPANADEGRSLVPLLEPSPEPNAAGAEGGSLDQGAREGAGSEDRVDIARSPSPPRFSGGNLYDLPAVMVEEGPWRFVLRANGVTELYDVVADPGERVNVVSRHPELEAKYRQLLEPRLAVFVAGKGGEADALSPETLEALRALGYVQ